MPRIVYAVVFTLIVAGLAWQGSIVGVASSSSTLAAWVTEASLPTNRAFLAATRGPDGRIYALGGDNRMKLQTAEAYDPKLNTWATLTPMPTGREMLAAATGSDHLVYAIGGWDGATPLQTVEAYNPQSTLWTGPTQLPTARWGLAATTSPNGRISVLGGSNSIVSACVNMPLSPCAGMPVVEIYDPVAMTWTCSIGDSSVGCAASTIAPMPHARYFFGVASGSDGRLYVAGGSDLGKDVKFLDVYDPKTNTWSSTAIPGTVTLVSRTAIVMGTDGRVYLVGGTTNCGASLGCQGSNQVAAYDPASSTWEVNTAALPPLPTNRWGLAAAVGANSYIYAIGGANNCTLGVCQFLPTVEAFLPPTHVLLPRVDNKTVGG